jgi:hypothetical protein
MSEIEELRAKLEESNQLKQECGRSLKALLEWAEKADMALYACVAALEEVWMLEDMGWTMEDKLNQALALARPLLKTRPERN